MNLSKVEMYEFFAISSLDNKMLNLPEEQYNLLSRLPLKGKAVRLYTLSSQEQEICENRHAL